MSHPILTFLFLTALLMFLSHGMFRVIHPKR